MVNQAAEQVFQKALRSLARGRRKEAMALFEAAIELERRLGTVRPQPRYLSYYGLCLALDRNAIGEGLRFCREAVAMEGYNPDIRCNLGRVLMRADLRREAYHNFVQGLSMQANHQGIRRALKAMGRRRRPVLSFLARDNVVNVILGRMRSFVA